jgi:hypothetical protein
MSGVGTELAKNTDLAKSWKSDAHCCWRRGVGEAARLQMVAMEA